MTFLGLLAPFGVNVIDTFIRTPRPCASALRLDLLSGSDSVATVAAEIVLLTFLRPLPETDTLPAPNPPLPGRLPVSNSPSTMQH